jgi:hypothetical protein
MAVFHYGEDFGWLRRLIADGEPYIGLGGTVGIRDKSLLRPWLTRCFDLIPSSTKVHGFGLASARLVMKFPWTSVDTGTWFQAAANGLVPIPTYVGNGEFDYSIKPNIITISDRDRSRSNHFDGLDRGDQARGRQYLEEYLGIALSEARYDYRVKWRTWIMYLQSLEKASGVKIALVTAPGFSELTRVLDACQIQNRLLSYANLKTKPGALAEYLSGPGPIKSKRTAPKADWNNETYTDWRKLELYRRSIATADDEDFEV